MPVVKVTNNLRNVIKEERKKRKIRGDTLSIEVGKSASYISQIEKGNIATIDVNILFEIFDKIIDLPKKDLPNYVLSLFNDNDIKLTEKDIKKEEWMINLEYQFRMFPITDDIIQFLKNKLDILNITGVELVDQINKNSSLDDDFKDKLEDNKVWININEDGVVHTAIKFNLSKNFIDDILNKKQKSINKINIQGILYNIFILEGRNDVDADILVDKTLNDFKFYTLEERNKLIKKAQKEKIDLNDLILKEDNECNKYINKVMKYFIMLRDLNPSFGLEVFSNFNNSLDLNKKLIYNILKLDFSKLKDLSDERKKDFIKDVIKLIDKYSELDKDDLIL
ncbi:helix-turn-helix transcriptional regulator [Clostridium botulinum]|uniref:helix-turn-helix domain-containing protein n=1 Tax=Clostridium botulinum TaxID=1491 RepID=UPI0017489398|nr:helix-turn-helix transcriptional regulator [Clostridium botulinum]MBD5643216.1 helix-turn-helix transcriptional regulator [Clostridium botulinum]